MMKHFITLIFLLWFLPMAMVAQSNGQLASRKVKYSREQVEEVKGGSIQIRIEETWYDGRGNALEEKVTDASGSAMSWKKMTRLRDGRMQKMEVLSTSGVVTESKHFKYDKFKKLTAEHTFDANGKEKERTEYTYNNSGDKVLEILFGDDGSVKRRVEFSYDSRGLLTSRKVTNAKGEITYSKITSYEY
jgi:hypothetical protein